MKDINDLGLLVDSNVPLIIIESHEEKRVLATVSRLASKRNIPCYSWTVTEGLKQIRIGFNFDKTPVDKEPDEVLASIKSNNQTALYVLNDFHPYLENEPRRIRMLKDIALDYKEIRQTVIFLSYRFSMPPDIKPFSAFFEMSLPSREQIVRLIKDEVAHWSTKNSGLKVQSDKLTIGKLIDSLQGVSLPEAKRLIRSAIIDDGAITKSDLPELNKTKFKLMDMDGVLTYEYEMANMNEVGGLRTLKGWLYKRREVLHGNNPSGLDNPKGILLLGVQGGGKSMAAKAVASHWHLPLLRLDFGSLYNKYYGETERNLRESLKIADTMAPCVLWMDEIEKGISAGLDDQGVSKRLLSTLLTWMAEREKMVFVAATANDVRKLPPELIRKGRLDEIFFVDLPDQEVRKEIFTIHLQKRGLGHKLYDVENLAEVSEGFSGAEIEQAIVAALYSIAGNGTELTSANIMEEINNTSPLSVVMAEDIAGLRVWASGRAVAAN
ncbi:MAG: AAA family ATPase [Desulfobulbaceae bacterium]|nr:AAA family ATPase [Desulfobulbaceae bacterium]